VNRALDSFWAEWLKLRKRPAVWVLGAILVALVALFGYGFLFLLLATQPPNATLGPGVTAEALRQTLHPAHWVQMTLGNFTANGVGPPIALILGVLGYGSEYGWTTMKTIFTLRPGRLATLAGKLGATALVLGVYVVAVFVATAACASAIGAADGALGTWPSPIDVAKGVLSAWLLLGMWAGLGMLLSVLFRQSALAIGLGLIYAIVLEGVVLNLAAQFAWVRSISPGFPGVNASALVRSFGSALEPTAAQAAAAGQTIGPVQAVLVLLLYLVVFVAISAALLRTRDVT